MPLKCIAYIHWEFLNHRFLRITYTYTKTQCFFFFPCKIKFYTWQKWKFVPVKNKCPWKNLKNPRKEPVKIFLKVCPCNSKKCPWKKKNAKLCPWNYIKSPCKHTVSACENSFVPREKIQKNTKKYPWKTKVGVQKINIWPKSGRENSFSACKKIEKTGKKTFHGHYFSTGEKKTLPKNGIF